MPLSEHEQQILEEIEKRLYQEDPGFARDVGRSPFNASRRFRLGLLAFIGGLGALIGFFLTQAVWIGVIAFGGMVAGIVLMAGAARGLVKSTSDGIPPKDKISGALARFEEKLRRRYKRD